MSVFRRTLVGLALFGIGFGFVEAAVVVYLRHIYEPLQHQVMPGRAMNDIFPLIDPALLQSRAPEAVRLLAIELGREAATIAMLASVAWIAGRGAWLASFAIAFGVWDLSFYAFLKLLIDWPASLATWDLLFLIPVPWVGPVWSPVVVSISLIVCGTIALRRPMAFRPLHWAAMLLGGAMILAAFLWDFRAMLAGELPEDFAWPLFVTGEILGLWAFWRGARVSAYPR